MSQNDFSIANADGATVRADINSALQALASQNAGTAAPSTTYAHQLWADTTANLLKIRNAANNAWVVIASWNGTTWIPAGNNILNGGTAGGTANAQTLTPTVPLVAYGSGNAYTFIPVATNTSGAVTVNVSALGTRNIKKFVGGAVGALAIGDLLINSPAIIVDDGTQFILLTQQTYAQGADIASSGTINLSTATGDYVHVTGTTGITAITIAQGLQATVVFDGILTLTNGASLIIPGGANVTTAAGDAAIFRGEAAGVVRCISYIKKDGTAISAASGITLNSQSTDYTLLNADKGLIVELTGATARTFSFTAAATLGSGWYCYIKNSATAEITVDPNGSETIDSVTSYKMYPGEVRLVQCSGTAFTTVILNGGAAVFNSSTTWVRSPGYTSFQFDIISGGGAGGSRTTTGNASGGGGGAYYSFMVPAASLVSVGSTETVTVGGATAGVTGNTAGTAGNNSSITINGVSMAISGGNGGQTAGVGTALYATQGGMPNLFNSSVFTTPIAGPFWSPYQSTINSNTAVAALLPYLYSGVGGDVTVGNVPAAGGISVQGGAGGGGCSSTAGGIRTGGTSVSGGAGGAGGANTGGAGTGGTAPGGGGGGAVQNGGSGAGAAGRIIVRGII